MADFGKVSDSFVKSNQSKKLQPLVSLLAKHVRMIIFFVPWLPRLRRTIQIKPKITFSDCVLLVEKYWFLHLPGKWNVTSFLAGDNNPLWWCIRKCETVKTNMWSYLWWWPRMAARSGSQWWLRPQFVNVTQWWVLFHMGRESWVKIRVVNLMLFVLAQSTLEKRLLISRVLLPVKIKKVTWSLISSSQMRGNKSTLWSSRK